MANDFIRPLLIGLVAGAAALALGRVLSRWLPDAVAGKPAQQLLREYRGVIWLANASFLFGLGTGLVLYKIVGFAENDLRPLGLSAGIALSAPMAVIHLAVAWAGRSPREAVAAYALHQRLPVVLLYWLTFVGVAVLVLSGVSFQGAY